MVENLLERVRRRNAELEGSVKLSHFSRTVILDPIALIDDQWDRLKRTTKELKLATDWSDFETLLEKARDSEEELCWINYDRLEGEDLEKALQGADSAIACSTIIHDEALRKTPELKALIYWTNIANQRVNTGLCRELGIDVIQEPGYGVMGVASLTVLGILSVLRNLPRSIRDTLHGTWYQEFIKTGANVPISTEQIVQDDLWYKRVGIIGFGPIGQNVAKLLKPYETELMYWTKNRRDENTERRFGVTYSSLDDIFSTCDIVTLHISADAKPNFVDERLLSKLKKGALFVNTANGSLVDYDALFRRAKKGDIKLYLDVYPTTPDKRLIRELSAKGNIFTYRHGWMTRDTMRYKGELLLHGIYDHIRRSYTSQHPLT